MIDEIRKFREKYPDYSDMSDIDLANRLAQKYPDSYSDLPAKVQAEASQMTQPPQTEFMEAPTEINPVGEQNISGISGNTGPTVLDIAKGAGETALSLGTGMTTGFGGYIAGTLKGIAQSIREGKFGTQEGADEVERIANEMASRFTYAPRTEEGQRYVENIADISQELAPLTPATAELQMIGQSARAAGQAARSIVPTSRSAQTIAQAAKAATKAEEQTIKATAQAAKGSSRAKEILAESASPNQETIRSAERLGIADYLQPDHVTTNQIYREIAQAVKSIPGSEARKAEILGLEEVAKRADKLIDDLGGTSDYSTLSTKVKDNMKSIQESLDFESDKLFRKVNSSIPPKTSVTPKKTLAWLETQIDELGGIKNLSPLEKTVYSSLKPKNIKNPTYANVDRIRKDLTAARIKKEGVFKDANSGLIKKLEGLLLDDQQSVAKEQGVLDVFNDARRTVAIRKGVENDMKSIFGRELEKSIVTPLTESVKNLPKGDVDKFIKLIKSVPEEMRQEVTASGLATAFGKSGKQSSISFTNYANWYENLSRNKQAYNALMSNLPKEAVGQLKDLYNVSQGISSAGKERITTGRLQVIQKQIENADSLIGNIYEVARKGALIEAATTSIGLPGTGLAGAIGSALTKGKTPIMKAADELISSPEFINAAKKIGTPDERIAVNRLANSGKFRRFANATKQGQKQILKNPRAWILRSANINNEENNNAE